MLTNEESTKLFHAMGVIESAVLVLNRKHIDDGSTASNLTSARNDLMDIWRDHGRGGVV